MPRIYNGGGNDSSIGGTQLQDYYYQRKALIDLKKEVFFTPLADVTAMPKHYGKTIKRYHYLPLLDDRNINDQGIDAAGVAMAITEFSVRIPYLAANRPLNTEADVTTTVAAYVAGDYVYDTNTDGWYLCIANRAIGANLTTSDTALTNAAIAALINAATDGAGAVVTLGQTTVTVQTVTYTTEADAIIVNAIIGGSNRAARYGNLYGSSKDVGTIAGKLPALSETGGRVNRVGFQRIQLEGSIEFFGFFDEYTRESIDFDTDSELMTHVNREMLRGAQEQTEDALQIDLLSGAGVHYFAGIATAKSEISGNNGSVCEATYANFSALSIELDNNRCPKDTKIMSGTRMQDTLTIPAARAMFIGSEMIPTIERMTDHFNNPAFIPIQKYAAGTKALNGEIGSVGYFRIIVVPEMQHWSGAGATEGVNDGYRVTNGQYDVFPMLVVGNESFTTIGFQTDGKTTKFKVYHKKPGKEMVSTVDPYGQMGIMSIQWYYGSMMLRTERLAIIYSVGRI